MSLLEFYMSVLKSMDKDFGKKLDKINKKCMNASVGNDERDKMKFKSELASEMGIPVVNTYVSLCADDAMEEESCHFAQILKMLGLYQIKNKDFFYWDEHIKLFSELEKHNFLDEHICKLHNFLLNNFNFNNGLEKVINHEMLRNPGVNILLILIHLDHLISRKWGFQSISLNQALKFKYKKNRPYFPSKTFTDFLLFILQLNAKFELNNGYRVEIPKSIPTIRGFEQWLDTSLEDEKIKKFIQIVKKVRENKSLFFLTDVYEFLGIPYGDYFENDEEASKEYYLFMRNELPEDKWSENINAIAGLWLIYFWQDFFYKHAEKTDSLSGLATSEDCIEIWKAFLEKYPSEGKHVWPSELILQDK